MMRTVCARTARWPSRFRLVVIILATNQKLAVPLISMWESKYAWWSTFPHEILCGNVMIPAHFDFIKNRPFSAHFLVQMRRTSRTVLQKKNFQPECSFLWIKRKAHVLPKNLLHENVCRSFLAEQVCFLIWSFVPINQKNRRCKQVSIDKFTVKNSLESKKWCFYRLDKNIFKVFL